MVNITALEEITRLISEKKIKPMKKWSLRLNSTIHNQYKENLKKSIGQLFELISGQDTIAMLRSNYKRNF